MILPPGAIELCWQKSLLVVDDDPIACESVSSVAQAQGWSTTGVATFDQAAERLKSHEFDCIVAETTLAGATLEPFLRGMAAHGDILPVLIVSAAPAAETAALADLGQSLGLNMCYPIGKPIPLATLTSRLTRIEERLRDGIDSCCHMDCHWRKSARAADA